MLRDDGRFYEEPFVVYVLLLVPFPFVLTIAGTLFLRRLPPVEELGPRKHSVFTCVIAPLTFMGVVLFVIFGAMAVASGGPQHIRE
jgi:hypothetical protein